MNMTNYTVAVWCITYNQKDFIKDALNGFIMQKTNFPFVVIVHDDKSTDGTTDIILEYAQKYPDIIIPVIETENQWSKGGLKHIINIMNNRFRIGKYIAFCEGDDYWTSPDKLQIQIDFLESHPDYSMCFHSAVKKYECDTIAWINCENIEDKDYDATDIFINWTVPTASVVCRKEAMDFYANIKGAERIQNYDIFIILSCAMTGKIRGISRKMSVYRIQGEGLTYNQKALRKCKMNNPEHFECLKENFPIVKRAPIDKTIAKTLFERALIQENITHCISDIISCIKSSPFTFLIMVGHLFKKKAKLFCSK